MKRCRSQNRWRDSVSDATSSLCAVDTAATLHCETFRMTKHRIGPERARSRLKAMTLQSTLGRRLAARRYWVVNENQPPAPRPLSDFRLFGILGTWMEGDIVAACIANAMNQGCDEVFFVDNSSPDDTVARAKAAGASPIGSFDTPFYDEHLRMHHMQSAAEYVTSRSRANHVWWLWLDADEFPVGPDPSTRIRDHLSQLDSRFSVVGSRYFEHFPDRPVPEVIASDPRILMPLCIERRDGPCFLHHRKHPLVRFDKGHPPPKMGSGFHRVDDVRGMIEPSIGIDLHHFPYRNESRTRIRLEMLHGSKDGTSRIAAHEELQLGRESNSTRRLRELDAVYEQRWPDIELIRQFGMPVDCPRPTIL